MRTTVNRNRKTTLQAQSRLSVPFSLHRSAALRRRAPLSALFTVEVASVSPLLLFVLLLPSMPFRIMTAEWQMQRAAETVRDRAVALAALSALEAARYRNSLGSLALAAARTAVSGPNLSELDAEYSSLLADSETVRVILDYGHTLPIPPFRLPAIRYNRTAWRRAWIGETDPKNCVAVNPEEEIVYVGRHSTRYHKTARRHYLYSDLHVVSPSRAAVTHSVSDGHYRACPVYVHDASGDTVYLMPSDTIWYRDSACRAIRIYVRVVPKRGVERLGPYSCCHPWKELPMLATTLSDCFSLTLFPLARACGDFLHQTVPRRLFELLLLLELGFYLWRLFFARAIVPTEFLFSLYLPLPLLAPSLLSREALGLGDVLFLLCLDLGTGFHHLPLLLTAGFLSVAFLSLLLLCRHSGRPKRAGTEHIPLLPLFLLPAPFCLFSSGKVLLWSDPCLYVLAPLLLWKHSMYSHFSFYHRP